MHACKEGETSRFNRYGLYPLLFAAMLGYAAFELSQPAGKVGSYYGIYLIALVMLLLVVESLRHLRAEWKMTKASFFRRDLPYMMIGGLTLGPVNYDAGWATLHFGMTRGASHAALPLVPCCWRCSSPISSGTGCIA
jgi:hypothetical protein